MSKILVIDDDVDILSAAKLFLKRHFDEVTIEKNPEKIPFLLNNYEFDLILLDMNFTQDVNTGREGFLWLDKILDLKPEVKVVLFTAYGDVEMAVKSIKLGAKDFVIKPWENDKLLATIKSALGEAPAPKKASSEDGIVGESDVMKKVFNTIDRVADTDANVLVLGENGTGKDLVASALHKLSNRKKESFVRVDLAAMPETLVESELFGHVKGAFTDAKDNRIGKFEEANKGTLFLDEIGNLSLPVQSKLLNVFQTRTIVKLGNNKPQNVDIRLVCATNSNIQEEVSKGGFRQDLLYRINTITIEMPPLRERAGDIELLGKHFLDIYKGRYNRKITGLSAALVKEMNRYNWPGNVRELQHSMERAVIMCQSNTLGVEDVFGEQHQFKTETNTAKSYDLENMEQQMIEKALKKFNGNITESAKELGLSRAALYRRIEKYGI
ncbi:sigma-54-dependent transcriptional regulator [Arcticibacterium luteifluviistationis]|uniref:Sigma-54-dependent Fis family transcriptional regulator n=1 Tax=Arcticibacterium luteifluviistationis TaxID=1784714 RepID=A0A2Z4GF61_9BACT|nr:sigma-54 dependent transcriptional regulator [Arcticibacterium luteifluviistationis]AWW00013.1 sigma-54-dependent Fis family transcriptional regulator [Arcticibacterium luteifluviistationis]